MAKKRMVGRMSFREKGREGREREREMFFLECRREERKKSVRNFEKTR